MKTIKTLYHLLAINTKIPDIHLRVMYLKDAWGLEQKTIAYIEGVSQQTISNYILKGKLTPSIDIEKAMDIHFSVDEIRYIQFLPREIIKDLEVVAFVNNVLGLDVFHPFYSHHEYSTNMRIVGMAGLGVQNKHAARIFKRKANSVSMVKRRYAHILENTKMESRYDATATFQLAVQKRTSKFMLAGGN